MEQIKLLLLYSARGFGGLPRNLSLIASKLDPARFEVHVAMLTDPGDTESDLRTYANFRKLPHVHFHQIGNGSTFERGSLKKLAELIKQKQIQVLSCHGYKADIFGSWLRRKVKVRFGLVAIAHGWGVRGARLRWYYRWDKRALKRFDKVVLLNDAQVHELGWRRIPEGKIEIIPNGIDLDFYATLPDRTEARKKLGISPDAPLIGYIGRLGMEKNIEDTVRALRHLIDKVPQTRFVMAGSGPAQASIFARAQTLGVSDRIVSVGYVQDVRKVLAALDVYVSNSVREGLPNSVLEAMAAGIPCVLSDIAGHRGIVQDGVNGFLVRPSDTNLCAQKIAELIRNPDLCRRFAAQGKVRILDSYSLDLRIERLAAVYEQAAAVGRLA